MDWIRLTDFVFLALTALALGLAIVRGYLATSHPLLWFLIGTGIFLHVGSINDHFRGANYVLAYEREFRVLELFHISMVVVGYILTAGTANSVEGPPTRQISGLRYLAAVPVVLALKFFLINPFEKFDPEISAYAKAPGLLAVSVGCLAVAVFEAYGARRRRIRQVLVGGFCLAMLVAGCFFRSRTPLMYGLAGLFLYVLWTFRHRSIRSRWARRLMVLLMPCFVVSAVAIGASVKGFAATVRSDVEFERAREFAIRHGVELRFIDAYGNGLFAYATHPTPFAFRNGESVLSVLLGPIPRGIWSEKPMGYAHHFTIERAGLAARKGGLSLSMSLLGDLWANGGWPSVLLTSFAFGVAMGLMQRWRRRHLGTVHLQVVYWQFLFMCLLSARGDFYTIFQRGLVFMVLTRVAGWFLSTRVRVRTAVESPRVLIDPPVPGVARLRSRDV